MPCSEVYADSYDFAVFWCQGGLTTGVDNSGGAGNAFLTDTTADFVASGVQPAMLVRNITDGSGGFITVVAPTVLTATLTGGTDNLWDNGDVYRLAGLSANEQAQIDVYLTVAAADINAALASVGACDCTLADWAAEYLKKLNVIEAAVIHACPCGRAQISDEMKTAWLGWLDRQFENLRTGAVEVCSGASGADFPVTSWAEQSVSEFAAAQIILNDMLR